MGRERLSVVSLQELSLHALVPTCKSRSAHWCESGTKAKGVANCFWIATDTCSTEKDQVCRAGKSMTGRPWALGMGELDAPTTIIVLSRPVANLPSTSLRFYTQLSTGLILGQRRFLLPWSAMQRLTADQNV